MLVQEGKLSEPTKKALLGSIKELSDVFHKLIYLKILDLEHVARILAGVRMRVDEQEEKAVAVAVDRLFEKVSKLGSSLNQLALSHKIQVSQYEFKPAVVSAYGDQKRIDEVAALSRRVEPVLSDERFRDEIFDLAYLLNVEQNNLKKQTGDLYCVKNWLEAFKEKKQDDYLKIDLTNDALATLTKVFGSLNGYFIRFGMMVGEVVKLLSKDNVNFQKKQSLLTAFEPLALYVKGLEQTYIMLLESNAIEPSKTSSLLRGTHAKAYALSKKSVPQEGDFLTVHPAFLRVKGSIQVLSERPRDQNPLQTRKLAIEAARKLEVELFSAVEQGHEKALSGILQRGANINAQDERGYTALHHAVKRRHVSCVKVLLDAGADVDISSYRGASAREFMRYFNDETMLTSLDAAPKKKTNVQVQKQKPGLKASRKLLMTEGEKAWVKRLHDAIVLGDDRALRRIIAQPNTMTGLLECLRESQGDITQVRYGDLNQTLLHIAALHGKVDCLLTLMHHGVLIDAVDDNGNTALHLATENNHHRVVRELIDNGCADVNKENGMGMAPLSIAIEKGLTQVFNFLVSRKQTHTSKPDSAGIPPLFQAIYRDNGVFVEKLYPKSGESVPRYQHEPLLFTAAKLGKMNALRVLLKKGESVDAVCTQGRYKDLAPIHIAIYNGNLQAVIALCLAGAALLKKAQAGYTALKIAELREKQTPFGGFIRQFITVAVEREQTLSNKVSHVLEDQEVSAKDASGNSAMHIAAMQSQLTQLCLLLLSGISLEVRNALGETPLHLADKATKRLLCARFLIAAGADVRAKTFNNTSVLEAAYTRENRELVNVVRKSLSLEPLSWFTWLTTSRESLVRDSQNSGQSPTLHFH